ncbi:MAG: ABC transporter permease [Acidimicrobiia bacterium]|nr:ABC transporter permease [Acidimicrobiia bacterium]
MKKPFAIAAANVRRLVRDRSNIFFVLILPLGIIIIIGSLFGGSFDPIIGVHNGDGASLSADLVASLESTDGLEIRVFDSEEDLIGDVERGDVDAGLVIPSDYSTTLQSGGTTTVGFAARPDGAGQELQAAIAAIVTEQGRLIKAARFAAANTQVEFDTALASARLIETSIPQTTVETEVLGEAIFGDSPGQFDSGASTQLVLFMFLTGLVGASALIQTRNYGVSRRMLSTPTSTGQIIIGEALGRFGVVILQGLYIMGATWLMFRVDWGDPLGAAAIVILFSAAAAGAAMLIGSVFDNDQQVGGFGVVAGIGLAALGGSMIPLEFYSETMQTVAHFTPHAWANEAFADMVRQGAGVGDILPHLGALTAFAVVLLVLAAWRLRVAITQP